MTLEQERALALAEAEAKAAAASVGGPPRAGMAQVGAGAEEAARGARGAASISPQLEAGASGAADTLMFGGSDEIGAALHMTVPEFAGVLHGDTAPYQRNLDEYRRRNAQLQKDYPAEFLGGQVVGTLPSLAIPGMAPVRGAGLAANGARLGIGSMAMGSLYGFGSGDDMNSRLWGAAEGGGFGAATGAATPFVGRGLGAVGSRIGSGTRAVVNAMRGQGSTIAERGAAGTLGMAAGADNLADAIVMQRELERVGPAAMPADLGPNMQAEAGRIARLPNSPAQRWVRDALAERQRGAAGRMQAGVDEALGPAPEPYRVTGEFSDATPVPPAGRDPAGGYSIREAQQALGTRYDEVLNNPQVRAVDTRQLADNLEAEIANRVGDPQAALRRVRQMLNIEGTDQLDPLPAKLHAVRKTIDGMRNATTDTEVRAALGDARRRIDEELAMKVPGIKELDVQYAELARQRQAFDLGRTVLQSGREAPTPGELQTRIDLAGDPTQSAAAAAAQQGPVEPGVNRASLGQVQGPSAAPFRLSQGTRAEIERLLGTGSGNVGDLARMIKGEGSWNRDRLAALFGEERADRVINIVENERLMAQTNQVAVGGSPTADKLAADARSPQSAPPRAQWHVSDIIPRLGRAAYEGVVGGARDASRQRRDLEIARMLTSQGPEATRSVQLVADAIRSRNRSLSNEQAINLTLTAMGRGGVPRMIGAVPPSAARTR